MRSHGLLHLIAREGDAAAGTNGADFDDLAGVPAVMNGSGTVAVVAKLRTGVGAVDGENDTGIWVKDTAQLTLAAREGSDAPGTDAVRFGDFLQPPIMNPPVINRAGTLAFRTNLQWSDNGAAWENSSGIWVRSPAGEVALLARSGNEAWPDSGVVLDYIGRPNINDAGTIAFQAGIRNSVSGARHALWAGRGGTWTLVARSNSPAPFADGSVFATIRESPDPVLISGSDLVGFCAGLESDTNGSSGIWAGRLDSLRLLVREGDMAPGSTGARFDTFRSSLSGRPFAINAQGDVAFLGQLVHGVGGVGPGNDFGLWVYDAIRNATVLLAREGDSMNIGTDATPDVRRITGVAFWPESGTEDGRPAGMNHAGQVGVRLLFSDGGEGVFLAELHGPCACNVDGEEGVDLLDLLTYLDLWFLSEPSAEFDGRHEQVDVFDLLQYLGCWFPASAGGCV